MAFPDLVTFPEHLSLYTPFVSGLGIDPATYNITYPTIDIPLTWKADTFLYLMLKDVPFFNAFNDPTTGWIKKLSFLSNDEFNKLNNLLKSQQNYLSGFSTGEVPPGSLGFRKFRAIEKIFTMVAKITSLSAKNATIEETTISKRVSATTLTSLNVIAPYLSSTFIEALSAKIDNLSSLNISATNALILNLTGVHLSSQDITVDLLTAKKGTIDTVSSVNIFTDNETVKFDITADTAHVRDLFISGTCHGCPTGGGGGTNIFDGVTAEYLEIINHHTDIPALRVTQFGDQPLAIFFDVTGHPEFNLGLIASGGVDIPGTPGEAFSIAINGTNNMVRMGSNTYGQLATNVSPVLTTEVTSYKFSKVSAKGATVLGLSADGSVYAWGYNVDGQVGNNTTINTSTPTCVLLNGINIPVISIAAGSNHSAAVLQNGQIYTWGSNSSGQLGLGLNNIILPNKKQPELNLTATGFLKVECGGQHTLALKTDGSLWAWGNNSLGQLGDGTFASKLIPTLIDNTRIYTFISCGINHSAAIDRDDNLFVWGANGYKQLGNNTTADSNIPVFIGKYKSVSCGFFHTIALTPAGIIHGWGRNHKNQVDAGAATSIGLPQALDSRTYTACFAGKDCTFGIASDGSTYGWGNNDNHQLGLATGVSITAPTSVSVGQASGINVAMIIDGSNERPGFVGINTSTPNRHLTVKGDISSSDTIFGNISAPTILTQGITGNTAEFTTANISSINVNTLSSTNITALTAKATNLNANSISATQINSIATNTTALTALTSTLTLANITSANIDTLKGRAATFSSISAQSLTGDVGHINTTLTVVNDLSVGGDIYGKILGDITTNTAVLTALTARNIYATETLGVGTSSFDAITSRNAQLFVSGNTVITGNLSTLGEEMFVDSKMYVNSAVRISNPHTETSLVVSQSGGLPVAEFYYTHRPWEIEQIALFIDGYGFSGDVPVSKYRGGYVGVRTKTPNEALTVRGNISASGNIYTDSGLIRASAVSATDATFNNITVPNLTIAGDLKANTLEITTTAKVDTLTARKGTITDSLSVANLIEAGMFKGAVSATSAILIGLTATDSQLTNLSSHYIVSDVGDFTYLSAVSSDINNLNTINLTSVNLSAVTLTATNITINNSLSVQSIKTDSLDTIVLNASTGNISGDLNIGRGLIVASGVDIGIDLHVGRNTTINNDLSVSRDVWVINDVHARRFHGEIVGPTVSIGTSADLISLSAQTGHINDLISEKLSATDFTALTAHIGYLEKLNTNTGYVSSLTAHDIKTDTITALSAFINDGYAFFTGLTAASAYTTYLSAATADISYLVKLNTNSAFISSLTSHDIHSDYISATEVEFNHITAKDLTAQNLTALTITIANSAIDTNLVVKQYGWNNLAEFYYNDTCTIGSPLSTALIIKGAGCLAAGANYAPGFVGIRTSNPTEALTVHGSILTDEDLYAQGNVGIGTITPRSKLDVIGKIWGSDIEVVNEIKGDVLRGNSINALEATIDTILVTDISAVSVNITSDLFVGGFIFGKLRGQFNGTGVNYFEQLSTESLTARYAQVDVISATNIVVPGGSSSQWNKAYSVPVTINMVIDGAGQSIEPGTKSFIEIPYDMQLQSWALYSDAPTTFSLAMTVLSSDFTNYPVAIPIFSDAPTLLPSTIKNTSSSLTNWKTTLLAGTVLFFGVSTESLPGGLATIDSTLMTLSLRGMRI